MEIHKVTVDGDDVWCYWTSTGTHSDSYLNIPATGNKVAYQGMDLYHFSDGKVVAIQDLPDVLTLLKQLGALPA
ncbi:MAG: ester cyclase, partial [Capsulimonadaceae bacterium]